MIESLNVIERAKLARRLQRNQLRINELEQLLVGVPLGTARFQDLAITIAKIASVSASKITSGTMSVNEQILINDGTTDRILITRDDIRISKQGVDVTQAITEGNKKDFVLLSLTELHKLRYADFVTGGSYTHSFNKIPIFHAFGVDSTSSPTEFYANKNARATTTQITNLPDPAYLMIFNEGGNP